MDIEHDIVICQVILNTIQRQYESAVCNSCTVHNYKNKRLVADTYLNYAQICYKNGNINDALIQLKHARIAINNFAEWVGHYIDYKVKAE